MDFARKRKDQLGIRSVAEMRKSGYLTGKPDPTKYINGPEFFDCLVRPWQRGEMTGILAGTGVGKTTLSLYILKHILKNNKDGIVIFVSLEMTAEEILEKWQKATEDEEGLDDRFFIIENFEEDGSCKCLSVADVKFELKKIKQALNETIHAVFIDHLHELDINGSMDYNPTCREIKNMTVEIDTHTFLLSQTTKEKGIGDIPVPKDGCFGTSRFENLMTNIITIFQPLRRVQSECNLPVLGYQYAKIRWKNKADKVKEQMNYCLIYDSDTEDLKKLNNDEVTTFTMYYEKVLELREREEKKKSYQFDLSTTIKGKDGKEVRLNRIVTGGEGE